MSDNGDLASDNDNKADVINSPHSKSDDRAGNKCDNGDLEAKPAVPPAQRSS